MRYALFSHDSLSFLYRVGIRAHLDYFELAQRKRLPLYRRD